MPKIAEMCERTSLFGDGLALSRHSRAFDYVLDYSVPLSIQVPIARHNVVSTMKTPYLCDQAAGVTRCK